MAVLLPIRKDPLISKLYVSNIQPLTSYDTKSSIATVISLPTEIVDSTSKSTVLETEDTKEKVVTQKGAISKYDVQNSQNFVDNINQRI